MADDPGQDGDATPVPRPPLTDPAPAPPRIDPVELLARLWKQNLPLVRDRVSFLENAAAAAKEGALTTSDRAEANGIAHKLAGSLGMFGYPRGTELAREMEQLLESPETSDPDRLTALAAELRSVLPL